jgi:hypothetical protein
MFAFLALSSEGEWSLVPTSWLGSWVLPCGLEFFDDLNDETGLPRVSLSTWLFVLTSILLCQTLSICVYLSPTRSPSMRTCSLEA